MPFGCVYGYSNGYINDNNKNNKYISKIVNNSFFIQNEINSQQILYPDYQDFFVLFDTYELLSIGEIDKTIVVTNNSNNDSYIVRYKDINWIPFPTYLTSSLSPRIYIRRLFGVHRNLLKNLYILHKKGIVHNNIRRNNILLLLDNDEPFLTNFKLSITNNSISKYFFRYSPQYTFWTFECHLCAYIIEKNVRVLSYMNLGTVIENYNLHALIKLEDNDAKEFEKYIGWNSDKIIEEIAKWRFTWDNFALTIMMIEIVNENISSGLDLTWYKEILYKCTHANPNKRLSIKQTNKLLVDSSFPKLQK